MTIERKPYGAGSYSLMGQSAYFHKKYKAAIKAFTKAISLRSEKKTGISYLWKRFWKNALDEDFTKWTNKGNANDYLMRGKAYYEIGNLATAIEDLTKAISLRDEENECDYFWRGWAYQAIGNDAAATEDAKKIILLGNGKYTTIFEAKKNNKYHIL